MSFVADANDWCIHACEQPVINCARNRSLLRPDVHSLISLRVGVQSPRADNRCLCNRLHLPNRRPRSVPVSHPLAQ
jgi:hypothetical protein